MGCLLFVVALLLPRVAIALIFLLTPWFEMVFETWFWPILGFLFMPYTTLAYALAALNSNGPIRPGWLVLIIVAILADLGHLGGGYRYRSRRPSV